MRIIYRFKTLLLLVVTILINSFISNAQKDTLDNEYSISIKQRFSTSGACGDKPYFEQAKVTLIKASGGKIEKNIVNDQLNKYIHFPGSYKLKDLQDINTLYDTSGDDNITQFEVQTYTTKIINDKHLTYNESIGKMRIGKKSISASASDPCDNFWGGGRESYTQTTEIYIDDPVYISFPNMKQSYNISSDLLAIKISDYYHNGSKPKLQVAQFNSNNWIDIDVIVSPGNTINLNYSNIAGSKWDPNSNYYKWLGKILKFRVVKTLLNEAVSIGNIASGVRFYPDGLQFSISHMRRTSCNDTAKAVIYVELEDLADTALTSNRSNLVWTGEVATVPFNAEMVPVGNEEPLKFKIIPHFEDTLKDPFEDKFEIHGKLELKDAKKEGIFACVREFTVPPKPDAITISQAKGIHVIPVSTTETDTFHLLSAENPYVVLNINDPIEAPYSRRPYRIQRGEEVLTELNKLPDTYESLSDLEKESLNTQLDSEVAKYFNENNEVEYVRWEQFFKQKYNEWYKTVKDGILFTDAVPVMTNSFNINDYWYGTIDSKSSFQLFHFNNSRFYYGHIEETTPFLLEPSDNSSYCYGRYIEPVYALDLTYRYNKFFTNTTINEKYRSYINNHLHNQDTSVEEFVVNFSCVDYNGLKATLVYYEGQNTTCNLNIYSTTKGSFEVHAASAQSMIVHDKADVSNKNSINLLRFYSYTSDETTEPDITPQIYSISKDGILPVLSSNGKVCLYTSSSYDGLYLASLDNLPNITSRKISSKGVKEILYINTADSYCIFKAQDNKNYKQYFSIPTVEKLIVSQPNFNDWQSEFIEQYKQERIQQQYGYRLYGIKINQLETLTLYDDDNCDYPFTYMVKVPEQPVFSHTLITSPSSVCSNNGVAIIKLEKNGTPPYNYDNNPINIGDQITVDNLKYGTNTIDFYKGGSKAFSYSFDVNSTANFDVEVWAQTSKEPNGRISVTTKLASGASIDYILFNKETGEKHLPQSDKFENLLAGNYKLQIDVDECYTIIKDVVVQGSIFSVDATPRNTDKFGGQGSFILSTKNRNGQSISFKGNVPYVLTNEVLTSDMKEYLNVSAGNYSFTANLTDVYGRTIEYEVSISILKPAFEAEVKISQQDGNTKLQAGLKQYNSLVIDPEFVLTDGNDIPISTGRALLLENLPAAAYKLKLASLTDMVECYSFSIPGGVITTTEQIIQPSCPNSSGLIKVTPKGGFEQDAIQMSIDGTSYSQQFEYPVVGTTFAYKLKDEAIHFNDALGNPITVTRSIINSFEALINPPEIVYANKVFPQDISCYGLNNGILSIDSIIGGNEKTRVQYKVDDGAWKEINDTIKGLFPGIHSFYVRDIGNNCPELKQGTFNISQPDTMLVENYSIGQPICELDNGSIEAEVTGGAGYYKYQWQFENAVLEERTELLEDTIIAIGASLKHGLYQLTVTDANNCIAQESFELEQYNNPFIEQVGVIDVSCFGEANGQITIESLNGSTAHDRIILSLDGNKLDSISELTSSFTGLVKGNYHLSVVDNNGCSSNQPYTAFVHQPDKAISVSIDTIRPVIDKGSNTGFIALTTDGGNIGEKTVVVSDGSSAVVTTDLIKSEVVHYIRQLSADEYTVTISDEKGCSITETNVEVIEPALPLSFTITEQLDARCKAQTGGFTVEGKGGWGGYAYKRASDAAFYPLNEFNNLYAGRYLLSVKDRLGAVFTDTVKISEPKDSLQVQLIDVQSASCNVGGQICVKGQGGTGPYRYVLNQGVDTIDVTGNLGHIYTNLTNRPYQISTIDDNGCRADMDVELDDQLELKGLTFKKTYPSTVAATDGQLLAVLEGGQAPFSFQWENLAGHVFAETGSQLTDIATGFYTVTVHDAGACSMHSATLLEAVTDSVLMVIDRGDETGYQKADGYIEYDYQRAYCQSVQVLYPDGRLVSFNGDEVNGLFNVNGHLYLSNLTGGQYHVLLTAVSGQNYTSSFAIEAYQPLTIAQVDRRHVSHKNGDDGEIKLTLSGGAAPFVFDWIHLEKNSAIGAFSSAYVSSLDKLTAGTYQVTVTDRYNNVLTEEVNILEPADALTVSIKEYRNESCKTYEDAYVVLQANGGWGDYQFRHDSVEHFVNSNDWRDLDVRNHTFYLTDKLGNIDSLKINITEPDYLRASVNVIDSVDCKGDANGVIGFNITGGTAPYRYNVASQPQDWKAGTEAQNLLAGHHTFYFTDANNCIGQDTIKVYMPEPDELLFNQQLVTHTTCNTDNGVITVAMQGGSAPYNYEWRNEASLLIGTDSVITSLAQNGLYTLDVYDYHGCHQQLEQRIKPSTLPLINTIATTPVLCYGDSTGTATVMDVTPAEPFAPYEFTWSNGQTDDSSTKWTSEMHHVTIADTNGCETTKWFMVDTPDSLRASIESIKHAHCFGYNDGFIKLLPQGGVGAYQFTWSNGDTEALADSLSKGDYKVLLTDGNACEYERTFTIVEPDELLVDLGDDIKICPDNTIVIDGQDFTTHRWYNDEGDLLNERFIEVGEEDDYYLEVTNDIGCFARDTITLTIGNDALQADFLMTSEAYLGDTLRVYELSNMPLDSLNWDYSGNAFLNVNSADMPDYVLHLLTLEDGMYNVSLQAYSGGCVSKMVKQVEVFELDGDQSPDVELGYQEPLIQSLKVAPNPTDGNFSVIIELREQADVQLSIYNVNQALKVNDRKQYGQSEYTIDYQLSGLSTGVYLVIVTAENERKQIKIVIN